MNEREVYLHGGPHSGKTLSEIPDEAQEWTIVSPCVIPGTFDLGQRRSVYKRTTEVVGGRVIFVYDETR